MLLLCYFPSSGQQGLLRPARRLRYPYRSATDATANPLPRMPSQLVSFFLHGSSPRFSWPASGAHVNAVLEMLPGRVLNTCPIYRQSLTRMRADTRVLPLLCIALRCSDGLARISSALSSGMCGETHPVC